MSSSDTHETAPAEEGEVLQLPGLPFAFQLPAGMKVDNLTPEVLEQIIQELKALAKCRQKLPQHNSVEDVCRLIQESSKIVVLSGAGMSVSAGIPDFRSENGLYATLKPKYPFLEDPSDLFSMSYFLKNPRVFYDLARDLWPGFGTITQYYPTTSHYLVKALECSGKLLRHYTQNIDTLEMRAGIGLHQMMPSEIAAEMVGIHLDDASKLSQLDSTKMDATTRKLETTAAMTVAASESSHSSASATSMDTTTDTSTSTSYSGISMQKTATDSSSKKEAAEEKTEKKKKVSSNRLIACHGSFVTASCVNCEFQVCGVEIENYIMTKDIPYCPYCTVPMAAECNLHECRKEVDKDPSAYSLHKHVPIVSRKVVKGDGSGEERATVRVPKWLVTDLVNGTPALRQFDDSAIRISLAPIKRDNERFVQMVFESGDPMVLSLVLDAFMVQMRSLPSFGVLKPDVVFFGEPLPESYHSQLSKDMEECDLVLIIGTSLMVAPVNRIPSDTPKHVPMVLINREVVGAPNAFDVHLLGDADVVCEHLCAELGWKKAAAVRYTDDEIEAGRMRLLESARRSGSHSMESLAGKTMSVIYRQVLGRRPHVHHITPLKVELRLPKRQQFTTVNDCYHVFRNGVPPPSPPGITEERMDAGMDMDATKEDLADARDVDMSISDATGLQIEEAEERDFLAEFLAGDHDSDIDEGGLQMDDSRLISADCDTEML